MNRIRTAILASLTVATLLLGWLTPASAGKKKGEEQYWVIEFGSFGVSEAPTREKAEQVAAAVRKRVGCETTITGPFTREAVGPTQGSGKKEVYGLKVIRQIVVEVMRPYVEKIQKLYPDAKIGYRGSLARGRKHEGKGGGPFDPKDFDVDALIVSAEFAKKFEPGTDFRDAGKEDGDIRRMQQEIDTKLREALRAKRKELGLPEKPLGLRNDPFTFRVWTPDEFEEEVGKDERYIIR